MKRFAVSNEKLGLFMLFSWVTLMMFNPVMEFIDDIVEPQPWFDASVEIHPPEDAEDYDGIENDGLPVFVYSRSIKRHLDGQFFTVVQVKRGDRGYVPLCNGTGTARYTPDMSGVTYMNWEYYLGKGCAVPETVFRVCTSWTMRNMKRRSRSFGPICTTDYDPKTSRALAFKFG